MLLPLAVACSCFPLLSLSLPSSHPHSLRSPSHSHSRFRTRAPSLGPPRLITYYADWAVPKSTNFSIFDIIIFAFALPNQNFELGWDNNYAPASLADLVPAAHAVSTQVMLSIGGWTGSKYFSDAVATPQNREKFANNILNTYNRYHLDGVDIDWEYPGQPGDAGNLERASDAANMLQFFDVLQRTLPRGALISAAVQDSTFAGPDGQPMKDVSAFSQFVDWITLMNYDISELRTPPGSNAPLYDGCGNSSHPTQTAVGGYNSWTMAGFPASKIVLGVPSYGYVVSSTSRRLSTRSAVRAIPDDVSGQIQFQGLISQGILTRLEDGSFAGAAGFTREWDSCSATPYLHSDSAAQVIPYDDMESLGMKAAWVRKMNMGGVNLFDVHGDTPQYDLTRALRANLSPSPVPVAQSTWPSAIPAPPWSPNVVAPPSANPFSSQSNPAPLGPSRLGGIVSAFPAK